MQYNGNFEFKLHAVWTLKSPGVYLEFGFEATESWAQLN